MKIIFNKNDMCEAVSPLQSGVSGKTALTATEGILFEAQAPDVCRMTTFDLEKGVRLSVRVEVIEEGAAIISAAKFSQTVRAMEDGEITLSVDDRNCVSITCGRASHTMNALPAADFPDLPRLRSVNGFTVPRKTLPVPQRYVYARDGRQAGYRRLRFLPDGGLLHARRDREPQRERRCPELPVHSAEQVGWGAVPPAGLQE